MRQITIRLTPKTCWICAVGTCCFQGQQNVEASGSSNCRVDRPTSVWVDASSLIPQVLKEITETDTIVTPHAGEFKRIFGQEVGVNEEQTISIVSKIATKYKITIILKGWLNIIADPTGKVASIRRSTPAMTVGGTGDVLAGLVAALYAKMDSPFDASALAVYFNGIAATAAAKQAGLHLVATDLIEKLPEVMKPYDKISSQKI